jgi:hypothetical protein
MLDGRRLLTTEDTEKDLSTDYADYTD